MRIKSTKVVNINFYVVLVFFFSFRIRNKNWNVRVSTAEGTQKTIFHRHSRHKSSLDTCNNPLTVLYDFDIIYISSLQSVSFIFVAKIFLLHCYRVATKRKVKDRDDCRLYEVPRHEN